MFAGTCITSCRSDGITCDNRKSGFTLLEAAVVLLVLSLVTSFAVVDLQAVSRRSNLLAAARQLGAELRLARIRAIRLNANYRIMLQPGAGWFARQSRVSGSYRDDGPPVQLVGGVSVVSCSSPSGAIGFRARGLAAEPGTVILAGSDTQRRKVVVDFNGEVRIE